MSFADRLKQARLEKGLTQQQLATLVNVKNTAISNYEKNQSFPNIDILYRIFDVLEIEPNFLFQDEIPFDTINVTASEREQLLKFRLLDNKEKETITFLINKFTQYKTSENNQQKYIYRAARSIDKRPAQILPYDEEKINRLKSLPTVESDDDL